MIKNLIPLLSALLALSCNSGHASTANPPGNSDAIIISAEGVGPVKLGMTAGELPEKVVGLYDNAVFENSDFALFSFYLDGSTIMNANGDNKIERLEICNYDAKVVTADGVYCGMPVKEFKAKKWKRVDSQTYTNAGVTASLSGDDTDRETTVNCLSTGEYDDSF